VPELPFTFDLGEVVFVAAARQLRDVLSET